MMHAKLWWETLKQHTCSSDFTFAFELGESPPIPQRFNDLSIMGGVEAGLRLLELRSGGVL